MATRCTGEAFLTFGALSSIKGHSRPLAHAWLWGFEGGYSGW
jgi:hypothetical protein